MLLQGYKVSRPLGTAAAFLCAADAGIETTRYVLCAAGSRVKVISVKTGDITRVLRGHSGAVTRVLICDTNAQRAYTASLDGTVRVWDFADGACLEVSCEL
jgi:WD40 repeat protein